MARLGKSIDYFSEDFKNLINSMLHSVPEKRATLETILKDPWFLKDEVSTLLEAKSLFE
jgi:serine/threonine protein kinase